RLGQVGERNQITISVHQKVKLPCSGYSIPYAEPPVGKLRFAKPEPIKTPIKDIISATKPKDSCIQPLSPFPNLTYSENCLFVNIWTQNVDTIGTSKLKPVMFFIHGGGLSIGSVFTESGSVLATNDVVIASTSYRLGQLGFLYGDREDAPGNVGFHDQLLALKWVRDNIHAFGGDRDQITIFGQSAEFNKYTKVITYPVLGTDFVPISAQKAFQEMKFNSDVDIIAGVATNEGSMFEANFGLQPTGNTTLDDIKRAIKTADDIYHNLDIHKLEEFYLKNVD
ncbi:unnamed protein product, partial [Oppiella nova]